MMCRDICARSVTPLSGQAGETMERTEDAIVPLVSALAVVGSEVERLTKVVDGYRATIAAHPELQFWISKDNPLKTII
jgi:hypothetical protein